MYGIGAPEHRSSEHRSCVRGLTVKPYALGLNGIQFGRGPPKDVSQQGHGTNRSLHPEATASPPWTDRARRPRLTARLFAAQVGGVLVGRKVPRINALAAPDERRHLPLCLGLRAPSLGLGVDVLGLRRRRRSRLLKHPAEVRVDPDALPAPAHQRVLDPLGLRPRRGVVAGLAVELARGLRGHQRRPCRQGRPPQGRQGAARGPSAAIRTEPPPEVLRGGGCAASRLSGRRSRR